MMTGFRSELEDIDIGGKIKFINQFNTKKCQLYKVVYYYLQFYFFNI